MENKENNKNSQHGILDLLALYIVTNRKVILTITAAVIIIAGGISFYAHNAEKRFQQQWGNLFIADLTFVNSEDKSLKAVEDFAAQNPSTNAGIYAAMTLGNAYYQLKDYDKAQTYFKHVMAQGNKEMAVLAEASLVAAKTAAKTYAEAIGQADSFAAKYPAHFALPQVLQHKALAMELSGDKAQAAALYKKITEDYPNTYYSVFSQMRLEALK